MATQLNSGVVLSLHAADTFPTDVRSFMAKTCNLLFLLDSASKLAQLLIMNLVGICSPLQFGEGLGVRFTNRIQREFLFNNCIQSYSIVPASKYSRQKTNFPKPNSLSLRSGRCCHFAPPTPPVNPQIKTTFLATLANHPPNPIV
jgi:hypothetical protein